MKQPTHWPSWAPWQSPRYPRYRKQQKTTTRASPRQHEPQSKKYAKLRDTGDGTRIDLVAAVRTDSAEMVVDRLFDRVAEVPCLLAYILGSLVQFVLKIVGGLLRIFLEISGCLPRCIDRFVNGTADLFSDCRLWLFTASNRKEANCKSHKETGSPAAKTMGVALHLKNSFMPYGMGVGAAHRSSSRSNLSIGTRKSTRKQWALQLQIGNDALPRSGATDTIWDIPWAEWRNWQTHGT